MGNPVVSLSETIAQQLKIKEFPFEIRDSKGNLIYFEDSTGGWTRREYDSEGREIYFENSNGKIIDNRSKTEQTELTLYEIAQKFGIPVSQLKIKK